MAGASDLLNYSGNMDLSNRPIVINPDNSYSTLRSMTFKEGGKHILIPTISEEGKVMNRQEAIDYYHTKNKYLGKFDSPEEANSYALKLHEAQKKYYQPEDDVIWNGGVPANRNVYFNSSYFPSMDWSSLLNIRGK
jgi:hypothetical protein